MPPSSNILRVGLFGTGFIAQSHAAALRSIPGVKLHAVYDRDSAAADSFANQWGVPHTVRSAAELPGHADVVHILAPPAFHAEAAQECLLGGSHVLIEKPFALFPRECDQVLSAARRANKVAAVNHNWAFHPAFLKLVRAIAKCELGEVEHVVISASLPLRQLAAKEFNHWMFQDFANILLEQAPHPFSQIHRLLGPVQRVATHVSRPLDLQSGSPFFRSWQIAMECERGTAQCCLNFGGTLFDSWIHVLGQDATALVDLRRNLFSLSRKSRFVPPVADLQQAWAIAIDHARQGTANFNSYMRGFLRLAPPNDPFPASFCSSLGGFYHSLASGLPLPAELACGGDIVAMCDLILRSAHLSTHTREAAVASR